MRQLCKGNVAVVKGAILAGCRGYYGYPITPASEIAEAAALYFPQVGGTFVQAESEVAAINMVYGAAAAGMRAMTGSSGPGLSLMQEGMSYLAGAELPLALQERFTAHIQQCENCRELVEDLQRIVAAAKMLDQQVIPFPIRERLREKLNNEFGLTLEPKPRPHLVK